MHPRVRYDLGMSSYVNRLAVIDRHERRRRQLAAQLEAVDAKRHAAIVDALDNGETLTAIAAVLDVSRQALTRYLARRENHGTA